MPPKKPTLLRPDDGPQYADWNAYVREATSNIEPFVMPVPPPAKPPEGYVPEHVEVPCPSGSAMEAVAEAQRTGDDAAAFVAIFGEELAPRIMLATAKLPFFVRAKLVGDIMKHYGMQAANLGD